MAWVLLMLFTAASLAIAEVHSWRAGFALVMVVAGGKAELIALDYMELRSVPRPWALAFAIVIWSGVLLVTGLHYFA